MLKKLYPLTLALLSAGATLAQTRPPGLPQPAQATENYVFNPTFKPDPNSRIEVDLQQLYFRSQAMHSPQQLQKEFEALNFKVPSSEAQTNAAPRGSAAGATPTVLVRITAKDVDALLPQLNSRGFQVVSSFPKLHFVEGYLPVAELAPNQGVSSLDRQGLLGVLPILLPHNNVGKVQNQADFVMEANRVRGAKPTGYTGKGVRVGVLSDSYNALNGAAADIASGDLPNNVQVIQDLAGQSDEGRAMIQLIHDVAPDAGLAFATAFISEGGFANNIRALADPAQGNCKIIVDDIFYFAEPFFQDGVIAQAVEEVTAKQGVAYYSSAGNQANSSVEYISPVFLPTTKGAADLNFAPEGSPTDTRQRFRIPRNGRFTLSLQWDDPFYTTNGVKTDLDLYLLRANGDTVVRRTTNNLLNQSPVEVLGFNNTLANDTTTYYDLVVRRRPGTPDPKRVKYILFSGNPALEYFLGAGTIVGHAAAANAQAVAAVPAYNRLVMESFSSFGSPTILFAPDGTRLPSPAPRPKPDITAPDGVSTTFFGGNFADPQDGYLFFGTSAAAPNAAAAAALLLQSNPNLTQNLLKQRLQSTARDLLTPGFDNRSGAGLINVYDAIFGQAKPVAGPIIETFDDGPGLARQWLLTDRQGARTLVRNSFGPASAPGQLIQDSFLPSFGITGTNEATLLLDLAATPTGGWTLTFRHKKFAGEDNQTMPASFTGNSNTDGVALSTNGGTTWYRLYDLANDTASTTTYKTTSIDLTAFAKQRNLTLGTDVRIRFQRYGTGRTDATNPALRGGRAFDDVAVTGPTDREAPVALFTVSTTPDSTICPGSSVQFRSAVLFGKPTSYQWQFPGGIPATSTEMNPLVTYPTAGIYDVTLTVTTDKGTATRTVKGAISVSDEVPVAAFAIQPVTPLCIGSIIQLVNQSAMTRCNTTFAWSMPGGSPATSTAMSPTVSYAKAGTYTITLTATNANGSTTQTKTVIIQEGASLPYAEKFEQGLPKTWAVINPDNSITWDINPSVVRKDGTRGPALSLPFGPYDALGQRDYLLSPLLNLAATQPTLRFDLSYAPYTSPQAANDSLAVFVYESCSNNQLGRVYLKSATMGLPTAAPQDAFFTPSAASQWREETVDLSAYASKVVYLRFVTYNQYGNNLYLTNVRVDNNTVTGTRAQADALALQAYPNPVNGGAALTLQLPQLAGTANIRLVDAVGRVTWQTQLALSATTSVRHTVATPLAAGIYTVLCQTADGKMFSRRVLVQQ